MKAWSVATLRNNVVFVGGCAAGLLLTDSATGGHPRHQGCRCRRRACDSSSVRRAGESRLPALGFVRDPDSDVICRWRHAATGVLFDLMPIDPAILGFFNRWYPEAARTATREKLNDRVEIRRIAAPAFIATKLDAFVSRGRSDFLSSHDLEDVLTVVDGRPSIVDELRTASDELRQFVRETVGALLSERTVRRIQDRTVTSEPRFEDYLPGLLADSSRTNIALDRLKSLAA